MRMNLLRPRSDALRSLRDQRSKAFKASRASGNPRNIVERPHQFGQIPCARFILFLGADFERCDDVAVDEVPPYLEFVTREGGEREREVAHAVAGAGFE